MSEKASSSIDVDGTNQSRSKNIKSLISNILRDDDCEIENLIDDGAETEKVSQRVKRTTRAIKPLDRKKLN